MKYLFMCSMGIDRSPTAAAVAEKIGKERGLELITEYDGLDQYKTPTVELLERFRGFDRIFVMEEPMQRKLVDWGLERKKVVCLNLSDDYRIKKPEDKAKLIGILDNQLRTEISWALNNP